eukprot:5017012-Pyramimonas_sp.AAC.1
MRIYCPRPLASRFSSQRRPTPATCKSGPRQEWPLVRGLRKDAGWPNLGAQATATASRSAIGGPHSARTRGHSGERSLLRVVDL